MPLVKRKMQWRKPEVWRVNADGWLIVDAEFWAQIARQIRNEKGGPQGPPSVNALTGNGVTISAKGK